MKTLILVLLSLFVLHCATSDIPAGFAKGILEEHNRVRRELGIKELVWNETMATIAQNWTDYLAANKLMKHSRTKGSGENLSRGTARTNNYTKLFKLWTNEVKYFIPGLNYPYCSTTGKGGSVGHYTQVIWGRSSQLGCGFSIGKGSSGDLAYLLCQYRTPGNYINSPVYTVTVPPVVNPPVNPPVEEEPDEEFPPAEETDEEPVEEEPEEEPPVETPGTIPTTTFAGLALADFKAKADTTSPNWSFTKWSVSYSFNTRVSSTKLWVTTMNAKCSLDKKSSWVKSGYFDSVELRHEHGHYYLGCLLALNFKKTTETTTFVRATYKDDIKKIYNDMVASTLAMEEKYDKETNFGLNKEAQRRWSTDLINQINGLKDYWW